MTKIVSFFDGDKRLETLYEAIETVIYERGKGIPIASIFGILELLKIGILEAQE